MVYELNAEAIDAFLREELFARVAFVDRRGRPNILPIAYAYDGKAFFGYSLLGAKVENMSAQPQVCLEIDRIEDAADWCSVVAYGIFELLDGDAAMDAIGRISDRLRTVARATGAPAAAAQTYVAREGGPGFAYRIRITEKHGRSAAAPAGATRF